jgi:hypothetical protein
MGTGKDIDIDDENFFIRQLRDKLWKEDKIKINGYTYSEWKKKIDETIYS